MIHHKINKRASLQVLQFFAIGLGIFIIGGCKTTSNDTAPLQYGPIKHNFEGNVIIIGAGAAGLAAAYQLEKNDVDYTILEATNHFGGRVQKNDSFADFPIDLGAEWIHADKNSLNHLIGLEGETPAQEVIFYSPQDTYTLSGDNLLKVPSFLLRLSSYINPEYKFKNTTWFDYLERNFANSVEHNIIYNSQVVSVDYSANEIVVTTLDGERFTADKVISTVSISVLKANNIAFIPSLPSKKIEAIQSVEFLPGFKLFLKFSNDFYADLISIENDRGEKTYYDVAYGKDRNDNVFGLLSTGDTAESYYKLGSEQKIVDAVLKELDSIYEGAASSSYLDEYLFKDWGRHEFTLGTWTSDNDQNRIQSLNSSLNNRVYFSGETHDTGGAVSTVHGAIQSGYTTANQVLNESTTKN